jgi:hypothetical protein
LEAETLMSILTHVLEINAADTSFSTGSLSSVPDSLVKTNYQVAKLVDVVHQLRCTYQQRMHAKQVRARLGRVSGSLLNWMFPACSPNVR